MLLRLKANQGNCSIQREAASSELLRCFSSFSAAAAAVDSQGEAGSWCWLTFCVCGAEEDKWENPGRGWECWFLCLKCNEISSQGPFRTILLSETGLNFFLQILQCWCRTPFTGWIVSMCVILVLVAQQQNWRDIFPFMNADWWAHFWVFCESNVNLHTISNSTGHVPLYDTAIFQCWMKSFPSPPLEQCFPLLFDIWQKEQLFNVDYSSAVWSAAQMSPPQCIWNGKGVCLLATLRGKIMAIISTSEQALRTLPCAGFLLLLLLPIA